jgi:CheY-like chemotaxis protein
MDDEEAVREVAGQMLIHLGYQVEYAGDGKEAVEMYEGAKAKGEGFDVVIMDLTVPGGMGGQEAVKRLLEVDPDARAIVSSGYSDDPVIAKFREYGFSGFLKKPYKIGDIARVVREVTEGKG